MANPLMHLKKELENYAKKTGKPELLSILENDRALLSLYELARLRSYPFAWLDKNQKTFLKSNGEKWLSEFLRKRPPVFLEGNYSSLHLTKIALVVNNILDELGFSFKINPTHIDRLLRLKIKPESYRKFTYIGVLLAILWGIKKGYFKDILTEKDIEYLKKFSIVVLERIVNHIKERRIKLSITEDEFETAAHIIREFDLDKECPNILYKFYQLKPLIKKEEKTNKESGELEDVEKFINLIHTVFAGNVTRSIEKEFKCKPSYLYNVLRRKSISPQVYEKFMTVANNLALSSNPEHKMLGEMLKKIITSKKVKKRGFARTYNFRVMKTAKSYDLGKRYLEFMLKNKDIKKIRKFSEEEIEALGKLLYSILDYINDKNKDLSSLQKIIIFEG